MISHQSKYLIIGNGAAAINAVEAIRAGDADGAITLVARESEHVYSRPLISYLLAGKVDDGGMDYRGRDFYDKHKVQTILGVEATKLDEAAREVTLSDGRRLGFEKLLIATGGKPIRPPIKNLDSPGVFAFTTWADEQAIEQFMTVHGKPRNAVVLGGGLIGLKTVEALVERDIPVTLVELADRILSVSFDKDASRLAEASLKSEGVTIRTGSTIDEVLCQDGRVSGAKLNDGSQVDCDMLVVAIGVRPDAAIAAGTSVKVDRGIVVDERMQSSVDGIFAAGDVAQVADAISGVSRPVPILPAAARQGRIAGVNMAGGKARYEGGVSMNAVDVVGLPTISIGQTLEEAGDEVLAKLDADIAVYRKIVIRKDRIIGALFIGRIERAGIFTGLIRSKVDVSTFKHLLLSDEFGLLSLPVDYRAHMVKGAGIEV